MASALSTFTDFVNTTGPSFLTSAEDVVNEACKNNYLLRRFMAGGGPSESAQGGSKIKDTIMFDEASTFQYYEPNETFAWQNPQVVENWEIDWRFCVDHMAFTDSEIELNLGGGLGRSARHQAYKRLKRIKEQRLWTSILNGMEDALFAQPVTGDMEASSGTKPYSIPAFVNETATTGLYNGFTSVQGLSPTTHPKWAPQQETYTATGANADGNIIAAFDKMFLDVQFTPPPSHQEYFEDPSLNAMFIACSKKGQNIYTQLLRESQDTFVTASRQDPAYMAPKFAGIDLVNAVALDTYAGYGTNQVATEGDATANFSGPRYYFLNGNYMKFIFHQTRYMYQHEVMRHPNQPFTSIVPVDSWYNFVCRSRQRQGIVSPASDLYTYAV
tara:strand:+ start:7623 stop:8780 length:1158 start_codon:yes stop_codon:yes gene_type:complete